MRRIQFVLVCLLAFGPAFARDTVSEMEPRIEEAVRLYLINNKTVDGPDVDYRSINVLEDELGQTHVRMQAVLNGYPVYGQQVIVHLWAGTREVISVDGLVESNHSGVAKRHMDPIMSLEAYFGNNKRSDDFELEEDPELAYVVSEKDMRFVYKVHVSYENEEGPHRDLLFFDVVTGEFVARHPQIHFARNRKTYDANNGTSLPGTLTRNENSSNTGDTCLDNAHNFGGDTYNYFSSVHGRDSLDNNGMAIVQTVHYDRNYNNAFWNGSQMVYGDGDGSTFSCFANDRDVVAHELAHGVTDHSADLVYQNESGALNEATSDIFAACVEQANGEPESNIWKLGEDVYTPGTSGDALRYMNNPTQDGSSKDYYPERYTGSSDNGGVHWNSGIANLFFYLSVKGGTHPRNKTNINVTAIGYNDAAKIWYRALTVYMNSNTNFSGARTHTLSAAKDLFGADSQQYATTCNAWAAVGVGSACGDGGGGGGGGGGGDPTGGELTNGQAVSGVSAAKGEWAKFYIDVPSGASNLVMSISGGSGDADLYTRFGSEPTTSSYDCRPWKDGNAESCTVASPSAGRYYVYLYGYAAFSSVSVVASFDGDGGGGGGGGGQCPDSGTASNISANAGEWKYYTTEVPACARSLTVSTSGGTGDSDLYVRFGSRPTTSSYDCRPYKWGNTESCTLAAQEGTWHIGLRAYSTFSGVNLTVSYSN